MRVRRWNGWGEFRRSSVILLLALLAAAPGSTQEPPTSSRPRLALALSGGGARGIAHIGVLQVFEEEGIPVDAIAGTSIGAVVGSIYATGRTARELEDVVKSLDWNSIFSGLPDRRLVPVLRREDQYRTVAGIGFDFWDLNLPGGLLAEYRVNRFLIETLAPASYAFDGDFDSLPRPFHAVAAALDNGEKVVLSRGNLARAVRASMSFPLAFPPVEWEGRPLVDGGMVDNLPVDEACEFGADLVVAVDITSLPLTPRQYRSAFGVAAQASQLLAQRANQANRVEPDVLIRPDLGAHSFNDYTGFDKLIEQGREAARKAIPEIRARLGEVLRPAPPRPAPRRQLAGTPIAEIQVRGNEHYSERLIRRTFNIPLGPPFDLKKGLLALDKVHAISFFDYLWLDVEPLETGLRIVLRVKEGPRNRIEVGARYDEQVRARGIVRFVNRNTLGFGERTELLGVASDGESGVLARLLSDRLISSVVGYDLALRSLNDKPRFFADGEEVNRAHFRRNDARFALQRAIKRTWAFESALRIGSVRTWEEAGLAFPAGTDEVRTLEVGGVVDALDDRQYPSRRVRVEAKGDWSLLGLGATHDYWKAELLARAAIPAGDRAVFQVDAFGGLSGKDLPAYEQFRLGGPVLLPGYHIQELWGQQAIAASLSFRYRLINNLQGVARAGAGNVWESREDIGLQSLPYGFSLGLYYPTRVGPVAANFGMRRGGSTLLTFSIGYP
jgi:NTE family protein